MRAQEHLELASRAQRREGWLHRLGSLVNETLANAPDSAVRSRQLQQCIEALGTSVAEQVPRTAQHGIPRDMMVIASSVVIPSGMVAGPAPYCPAQSSPVTPVCVLMQYGLAGAAGGRVEGHRCTQPQPCLGRPRGRTVPHAGAHWHSPSESAHRAELP
jgi:hypothetical protein